MAWVIGLDIGTSSTKGLLVDEAGQVVASASYPYELIQPAPGWAEQNPEDWWEATCTVVRKLIQKAGIQPSEVKALGLSGQMHGMVLIDQAGQVVRPPILWCDVRTTAECRAIEEAVGLEDLSSSPAIRLWRGSLPPSWSGCSGTSLTRWPALRPCSCLRITSASA